MSKALVTQPNAAAIEKILIHGDLAPMTESQRLVYVKSLCKAMGISLLFRPFDFIKYNGKVILYTNRAGTDQLRKKHKISIKIIKREFDDGLYIVTAQATLPSGRTDESIGAIAVKGLSGLEKSNALMKGETKAKRRVTLSIMGLGMLDEVEIQDALEKEAKIAQDVAIEETAEKLESTIGRPDFETEQPAPSLEPAAPPEPSAPTSTEYKLKSVKGAKGKALSKTPFKVLVNWLKFFDEMAAKGGPLHPDVQDDAFHIRPFLQEAAITKAGPPNE
jgi:hypothetical protein